MFSVTQRLEMISRPQKYISHDLFIEEEYLDNFTPVTIPTEYAAIQGMVVDYMTRYMLSNDKLSAFDISLKGANQIDYFYKNKTRLEYNHALSLINQITGLDDMSIFSACQIVGYDVGYRRGGNYFRGVDWIKPSQEIINNIRIMINRCLAFMKKVGPVVLDGFTFDGGYTTLVSSGDGDYLTNDMLIDFKVTKTSYSSKWGLQLLMYYLLGIHSKYQQFETVKYLCIFNPFINKSYIISINNISDKTKYLVSNKVLGYKMKNDYTSCKQENYTDDEIFSSWKMVNGSDLQVILAIAENNKQTNFDIAKYADGIHKITIADYWTYLRNIDDSYRNKIRPSFSYIDYIIMIKKKDYTMFFCVNTTGNICILNGAQKVKANYKPEYYFIELEHYISNVMSRFSKYWDTIYSLASNLKELKPDNEVIKNIYYKQYLHNYAKEDSLSFQEFLKEFENTFKIEGTVRGCIIDIDYFNHIYINPVDGTILPYWATSKGKKFSYKNIIELVKHRRPEFYLPLKNFIDSHQNSSLIMQSNNEATILIDRKYIDNIDFLKENKDNMYELSNYLKNLQYIYTNKMIRKWDDILFDEDNTQLKSNYINKKKYNSKSHYIGKKKKQKNGKYATITGYRNYSDMDVVFDDGAIMEHVVLHHWKNGDLGNC
ncbi:MAG: hypothetical protein J6B84_07420 [Eubacterium sp.]|nr:hypothetical protein [Eubacterium sp.]